MKKIFVILGLSLALAACGGGDKSKPPGGSEADSAQATDQAAVAHNSDAANDTAANNIGTTKAAGTPDNKGEALMANNDCNTCHNTNSKVIGPALVDIAKKYTESDIDKLADKVIKGGSGNWGTVPMTAHPDLAVNDAKEMVKYILSVKE
ncbi:MULTISPECIES: c-type cytochrome [unclassified Mucilaginibacter]|uniref:c-type cytochrome n=1 Tax=unclassified Mucilaginibacter TaxID=2617802 RepID=UPI00138CFEA1|nr:MULTISPECIES: c-type cytochrome [unclassified Mucilaginibacter]MBB5394023.1 cytochrome c [Mucilaginibacter sp. AK015]QHS57580.1 c-type cytochrome [Mucilaginibacter sp. 14171R-50]